MTYPNAISLADVLDLVDTQLVGTGLTKGVILRACGLLLADQKYWAGIHPFLQSIAQKDTQLNSLLRTKDWTKLQAQISEVSEETLEYFSVLYWAQIDCYEKARIRTQGQSQKVLPFERQELCEVYRLFKSIHARSKDPYTQRIVQYVSKMCRAYGGVCYEIIATNAGQTQHIRKALAPLCMGVEKIDSTDSRFRVWIEERKLRYLAAFAVNYSGDCFFRRVLTIKRSRVYETTPRMSVFSAMARQAHVESLKAQYGWDWYREYFDLNTALSCNTKKGEDNASASLE